MNDNLPRKRKKRCKWEIIHAVLRVCNNNKYSTKTRIQQMAYIDWRSFHRYFDLILNKGFIEEYHDSPNYYEITEKGKKFLEQLDNLDDNKIF